MGRIVSLKDEKNFTKITKDIDFSKVKIEELNGTKEILTKVIKLYDKKYKFGFNVQGFEKRKLEILYQKKFKYFDIELTSEVSESFSKNFLSNQFYKTKELHDLIEYTENIKVYRIKLSRKGENILSYNTYCVPGLRCKSSVLKYKYRVRRSVINSVNKDEKEYYQVLDLEHVLGICEFIEMCYDYLTKDRTLIDGQQQSYFKVAYEKEDIEEILDIKYLLNLNFNMLSPKIKCLLCEVVINLSYIQSSINYNKKYVKSLNGLYSKSFQTKRNIPEKYLNIMRNTSLLEDFSFVEIDESVDIPKFKKIEKEFSVVKKNLKLKKYLKQIPELRFRRLGQHKASGMYYPDYKCICVDITEPSSFIHELGHHIDLSTGNTSRSMDSKFKILAIKYRKELLESVSLSDMDTQEYYKTKKSYYNTPTEIWARCFEIFLVKIKKCESSLMPAKHALIVKKGYPNCSKELLEIINQYYSEIIPNLKENLDLTLKEEVNTTKLKRNGNINNLKVKQYKVSIGEEKSIIDSDIMQMVFVV